MDCKKHYYLMISCPGDVVKEREWLQECVEGINHENLYNSWVELLYWVTDTFSDAGMPAQESINWQMVDRSDGLIAIFNARLGTPVHNYPCGTAEEMELMLSKGKHVWLLFNTVPQIDLTRADAIEQVTKLCNYKKEKTPISYYREFRDEKGFKDVVTREIRMWLRELNEPRNPVGVSERGAVEETEKKMDNDEGESAGHIQLTPEEVSDNVKTDNQDAIELIDYVLYISNASIEIKTLLEGYDAVLSEFRNKTADFIRNVNVVSRQKESATAVTALCSSYAHVTKSLGAQLNDIKVDLRVKWDVLHSYVEMMPMESLTQDDKIIVRTTFTFLCGQFSGLITKTCELFEMMERTPYFSKEHMDSKEIIKEVFIEINELLKSALLACRNLENRF